MKHPTNEKELKEFAQTHDMYEKVVYDEKGKEVLVPVIIEADSIPVNGTYIRKPDGEKIQALRQMFLNNQSKIENKNRF